MKIKDLSGQKFGKLQAIRHIGTKNGESIFLCECSCGSITCKKTVEVRGSHLRSGNSTTCGGWRGFNFRKRPFESVYHRIMNYKAMKKEGSTLTYEEFLEFTKQPACFYCGGALKWQPYESNQNYNLDRKDNNKGYTKENCAVCCKTCNYAKGNRYTFEEWVAMTKALREYRSKL